MTLANDLDSRALQQVLAGHPSALLELYDRHAPLLFAHVYALLRDRDAAEDVVQETFTAAWFEVKSWFNAPRDVFDWLMEIARARLMDRAPAAAPPEAVPLQPAPALPRALRDRVLDSIYGAGERLRPPYSTPQWARQFGAHWVVWLAVLIVAALILVWA
ncbi:MAG TPA: sigma-70 family RNA polymerase sigma factor [Vicinamibacterales bacterium]|nr:sigma-70 family RNA polymerase sigma factor [Vicinamibacterales bacterium]